MYQYIYEFIGQVLLDVSSIQGMSAADLALYNLITHVISITIAITILVFCYKFIKWIFYKIANGGN